LEAKAEATKADLENLSISVVFSKSNKLKSVIGTSAHTKTELMMLFEKANVKRK
jgi:phosphotransferase system IIB component